MNESTAIPEDNTTYEQTPSSWDKIENIQNYLANTLRRRDRGAQIEMSEVLAELEAKLAEPIAEEAKPADIASGDIDYWGQVAKCKQTVETGLAGLNHILGGGLEAQRLMILLGAPGGGKTTLANQIAVHAADKGRPILYVTSEDMPFTLLAKTLARQGQIGYTPVLKGYESEHTHIQQALETYQNSLAATRLRYLDATMGTDLATIRERAKAHFEQYKDAGNGILVIDYLQRVARSLPAYRNGSTDLRLAVTDLTERLRGVASELDCCVIALAAQHRASGYGAAKNALASGKESGDIEYTADVVMAVGDDSERQMAVTWLQPKILRVDKNRQGPSGDDCVLHLDWYGERQQFTEAFEIEMTETEDIPSRNGRKRGSK